MWRSLSVAFFVACLCAGCEERSGAPLHLVLPDGFTGAIQIIEDSTQGLEVRENAGRFTYVIPPGGQLRVHSLVPFTRWHTLSASFQSGGVLPCDTDGNIPEDSIALRSIGVEVSNHVRTVLYYVGTKKIRMF